MCCSKLLIKATEVTLINQSIKRITITLMANLPRTRKRVFGLLRAPDGSAFQHCDVCGISVAVALYDMHECNLKSRFKKFKGGYQNQKSIEEDINECMLERKEKKCKSDVCNPSIDKEKFSNQPRSPFCFFMEKFRENQKSENCIDVERRGFQGWINMAKEERRSYFDEAQRVNLACERTLLQDIDDAKDDDEADSEMVGKFDASYNPWFNSECSGSPQHSDGYEWYIPPYWVN